MVHSSSTTPGSLPIYSTMTIHPDYQSSTSVLIRPLLRFTILQMSPHSLISRFFTSFLVPRSHSTEHSYRLNCGVGCMYDSIIEHVYIFPRVQGFLVSRGRRWTESIGASQTQVRRWSAMTFTLAPLWRAGCFTVQTPLIGVTLRKLCQKGYTCLSFHVLPEFTVLVSSLILTFA